MYKNLQEIGKSLLWLLGALILISQTYRIVAYYIFDADFDVDVYKDVPFALFGIMLMYVQNGIKTFARNTLKKAGEKLNNKKV